MMAMPRTASVWPVSTRSHLPEQRLLSFLLFYIHQRWGRRMRRSNKMIVPSKILSRITVYTGTVCVLSAYGNSRDGQGIHNDITAEK
jgi:hypothetical protein